MGCDSQLGANLRKSHLTHPGQQTNQTQKQRQRRPFLSKIWSDIFYTLFYLSSRYSRCTLRRRKKKSKLAYLSRKSIIQLSMNFSSTTLVTDFISLKPISKDNRRRASERAMTKKLIGIFSVRRRFTRIIYEAHRASCRVGTKARLSEVYFFCSLVIRRIGKCEDVAEASEASAREASPDEVAG